MERSLRMIAGSIVVLAGATLFGMASIAVSAASWGRQTSNDGEVAGFWGIFVGAVLVLIGLVLIFRTGAPDPLKKAIQEKYET